MKLYGEMDRRERLKWLAMDILWGVVFVVGIFLALFTSFFGASR